MATQPLETPNPTAPGEATRAQRKEATRSDVADIGVTRRAIIIRQHASFSVTA